jgi:hypothetical protein
VKQPGGDSIRRLRRRRRAIAVLQRVLKRRKLGRNGRGPGVALHRHDVTMPPPTAGRVAHVVPLPIVMVPPPTKIGGVASPANIDGRSLLPLLLGRRPPSGERWP